MNAKNLADVLKSASVGTCLSRRNGVEFGSFFSRECFTAMLLSRNAPDADRGRAESTARIIAIIAALCFRHVFCACTT